MKSEQNLKMVVPFNAEDDGTSRTVKAQYYKNGFVNFFIGADYGATGVIEIYEADDK